MIQVPQILNGCVLFPHLSDWTTKVAPKRVWETEIAESIKGAESRASMRAVPRRSVTFSITADLRERVRLEARMDAAAATGFACAPLHSRSSTLTNAVAAGAQANILLNLNGAWNWKAGDYAILIRDDVTYDVLAVINSGLTADGTWTADSGLPVDQPALSLAGPLTYGWPANALVWPLIFGRFSAGKESALNGHYGGVAITVSELVSGRSAQVGQLPVPRPGIGQQVIGKTNKI